jgi:hypothetical protein
VEPFWNDPIDAALPVVHGDSFYAAVDMPLMQRATRTLRRLQPADMKVLMDALQQRHGAEYLLWRELAATEQATVDFIDDPKHRPNPVIRDISRRIGTSIEDLLPIAQREEEKFRTRARAAKSAANMTELGARALTGRHAFYADAEMSEAILAGANRDIQDLALTPADLPSPQGILVMNRADGTGAVLWWAAGPDNTVRVSTKSLESLERWLLADPHGNPYPLHPYAVATLSDPLSDEPPAVQDPAVQSETPDPIPEATRFDAADPSEVLLLLLSFAHMVRQGIADVGTVSTPPAPVIDRKGRKRFRKDTVTLLSLHEKVTAVDRTGE